MGWLASFKSLRGLGIPPLLAGAALLGLFFYLRHTSSTDQSQERAAAA